MNRIEQDKNTLIEAVRLGDEQIKNSQTVEFTEELMKDILNEARIRAQENVELNPDVLP